MSNKIKRSGFILYEYRAGSVTFTEYCANEKELKKAHINHLDDKWDLSGRHKIHYFCLNISTGRFCSLQRWKRDFDQSKGFDQCKLTVPSKKM